jgi:hypothetical protein
MTVGRDTLDVTRNGAMLRSISNQPERTMQQHETRTIGQDTGIGDIFHADVQYEDGGTGRIVVYGGNLQGCGSLLRAFAPIWRFSVLRIA